MGADQHITDPADRAELIARAYELYLQYGSLTKVREHLAADPVTLRVKGRPHHFGTTTLKDWVEEGRAAEAYVELLNIAEQRRDSNARLDMIAGLLRDWFATHGIVSSREVLKLADQLLKIEANRQDLLGLRAPIKVQNVPQGPAEVDPEIVAAVDAARRRNDERQREIIESDYPSPTSLPARRSRSRRTGT